MPELIFLGVSLHCAVRGRTSFNHSGGVFVVNSFELGKFPILMETSIRNLSIDVRLGATRRQAEREYGST